MSPEPAALLECRQLTVRVPGRTLVSDLELSLHGGGLVAILGTNGSGKSLTLHTLAGLRAAQAGSVLLDGAPLAAAGRRQVARILALLPQHTDDVFPATVFDTALVGRHPHIPRLQWESAADRDIARRCLERLHLLEMQERDVLTLSGGERRRLAIAQVLAQAPRVYLLDEPTNHLDPQHQLEVLSIFSAQARAGDAVVASLHDVNLAARYADRCLLLYGDGRWDLGPTADVLEPGRLSRLYRTPMEPLPWRGTELFIARGAAGGERSAPG